MGKTFYYLLPTLIIQTKTMQTWLMVLQTNIQPAQVLNSNFTCANQGFYGSFGMIGINTLN